MDIKVLFKLTGTPKQRNHHDNFMGLGSKGTDEIKSLVNTFIIDTEVELFQECRYNLIICSLYVSTNRYGCQTSHIQRISLMYRMMIFLCVSLFMHKCISSHNTENYNFSEGMKKKV